MTETPNDSSAVTLPPTLPHPAAGDPAPTEHGRGPRRRGPRVVIALSLAAIVAVTVLVAPWDAGRRQTIADQLTVWSNPPATEIVALAEATGMTETARRIFYASRPLVEGAESFNQHCTVEDQTLLGCFDGERIYVYRVDDERLAGTTEVTAAHEMLHAAYQRLGTAERAELDRLVSSVVDSLTADHPVATLLERYPAHQHADEWHARLGTEFAELPAELETHFAVYFEDRAALVALHARATGELRELQDRIDALDGELAALDRDLNERADRYQQGVDAYHRWVDDFNARAESNGFPTREAFDAERGRIIAEQARLEEERTALNAEVERYNEMLGELRELDENRADLYSSLDSTAEGTEAVR